MSCSHPAGGAGTPSGWNDTSSSNVGSTGVLVGVGASVVGATVVGAAVVGAAVVGAAVVGAAVVDVGASTAAMRMAVILVWTPPSKVRSRVPSATVTATVDVAIGFASVVVTRSWTTTPSTWAE